MGEPRMPTALPSPVDRGGDGLAVEGENQLIVATEVTSNASDPGRLVGTPS